jgi:hypothetical protein
MRTPPRAAEHSCYVPWCMARRDKHSVVHMTGSMHSKRSMMRGQVGTAAITAFATVLIVAFLTFALHMNDIPTFEYICPVQSSTSTHASDKSTPTTPASTLVKTVATSTSIPNTRFIINFGDSYSRTGFKWKKAGKGSEINPSAKNPLGNPFPGITSAGGINWLGYMAARYNKTMTLVWNYSRSGAVTDRNITPINETKYTDFAEQIQQFNLTIGQRPDYAPWTAENAVAGIWFGVNDLGNARGWNNLSTIPPMVAESLVNQAQVLHTMGLRNFLFIEMPREFTFDR